MMNGSQTGRPTGRPKGIGKGLPLGVCVPIEQRKVTFWENVSPLIKTGKEQECWEWMGRLNSKGYGRFCFQASLWLAHRFSWMLERGTIPDGMNVLHRCDNRKCVNPNHLFLGTLSYNMKDCFAKGRGHHPPSSAKITPDQVRMIRKMWVPYRVSVRMISEKFGFPYKSVENAVTPGKWIHVE